jgi:hypothetical protein
MPKFQHATFAAVLEATLPLEFLQRINFTWWDGDPS